MINHVILKYRYTGVRILLIMLYFNEEILHIHRRSIPDCVMNC